jgi:hypothetical protein
MARTTLCVIAALAAGMLASSAAARPTIWIRFEPRLGDQVYLPVRLDGHPITALLDSGASQSVIDTAYAASIGLKGHGAFANNGANGRETSGHIDGTRLEVGDLTLRRLTLATLDLGTTLGPSRPMILGEEIFNQAVVDIDFARRRVAFRDPTHFIAPRGAIEVPLIRDGDLRLVPASIEGGPPALFEFDLGAAGTVVLSPAYARGAHLLDGRPTSQGTIFGVGGNGTETRAVLRELTFAGIGFGGIDAHFPQTWPSGTFSDRVKGVLGAMVLSRFHLIVDYPHDRLYAFPNPDGP